MADIKFACPNCEQHIQAEQGYAGLKISCPSCHATFVVPGATAVSMAAAPVYAAAPPPVPTRTSVAAPAAAPVAAPAPAAGGCPSCGSALPRGAVLCTKCGYNLATAQRTVAGRPAAPGKPKATHGEAPWYKTPYPYLGVVVLMLIGLYLLGRENPTIMLLFLGLAVAYNLTAHIIVVVAAFQEGAGTGFLTLCVPFYAFYFVFKVSDNDTLKVLYSVAALIGISLRFLGRLHD